MSSIDQIVRGRVVVVTGAASGIGRELASRWTARGAHVAALDLDDIGLKCLVDAGGAALGLVCDVTDHEQVVATVDQVEEELGPVDMLVNAAGIARMGRIGELPVANARTVMAVNYLGTAHLVDRVLPRMRSRGRGNIVNFASIAGWLPGPGGSAYVASKFAVVGYTECLAMELADTPIRVHCVCPPTVATPMLDGIMESGVVPSRAVELVKPLEPGDVVDAIERSVSRRRLHVFPGRGTSTMIRVRRFLPALTTRMMRLLYGVD